MKKTVSVLLFGIVLTGWALTPLSSKAAAPMPPEVAVNHDTRQCAVVMRGDECVDCSLPEGWEIVGCEGQVECPAGYTQVNLELTCKGIRTLRCCLPGHSGGQGDCVGVALDALLLTTPCLLVGFIVAGVLILRKQREKRKKRLQQTDGDAPSEDKYHPFSARLSNATLLINIIISGMIMDNLYLLIINPCFNESHDLHTI